MTEHIEEIAYRNRPPLLEDASIRGPTRTPVPGAMLTLDDRDAIEVDFRWYRYSKFALPCLCTIVFLAVAVFGLTAWYQVGDVGKFDAEPIDDDANTNPSPTKIRAIARQWVTDAETDADDEAGIPKKLRNIRIAYVVFAFVAILLTFLTLIMKPRPKLRTSLNLLWVIFFLVAAVLAAIAFVWGLDKIDDAKHCSSDAGFTFEACTNKTWKHIVQTVADGFVAFFSLLVLALLALYSASGDWRIQRAGWRERERDAQQESKTQSDPAHLAKHNIRNTRMTFLTILLFILLALVILSTVMIISIHLDHMKFNANSDFVSGWPARNTRLRYAATTVVILAALLNLVPFVHRLIAYIFAFIYFAASVALFVAFSLDLHEIENADHRPCPVGVSCRQDPFIATACLEFLLALVLLVYVVWEFCCKCAKKSVHSQRNYAPHELAKHDKSLDSFRPVRCDLTGRVLPAKEYVYRWRFIAGTPSAAAYTPLYPNQPVFPAEGYTPAAPVVPAAAPMVAPVAPVAPAPLAAPVYETPFVAGAPLAPSVIPAGPQFAAQPIAGQW